MSAPKKAAPEKWEKVIVRMPTALHRDIKKLAASEDRSMAAEIRRALRFYLEARA